MGGQGFEAATFSGAGLACRRGGHSVFAGLSFALRSGDALVLRGANGSGKTTLLRLMAGLGAASGGHLAWNGVDIGEDPEAHGARSHLIGHLDGVKSALSLVENLKFAANLRRTGQNPLISMALERFGLAALANLPARVLSAGQRHRLALARLVAAPAPLWLLDEPTNALDEASCRALAVVIDEHRAAGGMAVLASHGDVPAANVSTLDLGAFVARTAGHWSDAA